MKMCCKWFLLWGIVIQTAFVSANQHERALYDDLFKQYNVNERPVRNLSQPVTVGLKITLFQIVDVDEKHNVLKTNLWIQQDWNDYFLQWDPEHYGGLFSLTVPSNKIWKPDIYLYNSADENSFKLGPTKVTVFSTGTVTWIYPLFAQSICTIDVSSYPFDEQMCSLKFGSWSHNGFEIDFKPFDFDRQTVDLSEYTQNNKWGLIDARLVREESKYECCPEPYVNVVFKINLRRKSLSYDVTLIIPSVLVYLMVWLSFVLPVEVGQRITWLILILLTMSIFLTGIVLMSPQWLYGTPLTIIFFSVDLFVVVLSLVLTAVVLNLYYRTGETHNMSPLTRKVFLQCLPCIFCMRNRTYKTKGKVTEPETEKLITPGLNVASNDVNATSNCDVGLVTHPNAQQPLLTMLRHVYNELKFIGERLTYESEVRNSRNEWKFVARVVDRLCFFIVTLIIICCTCAVVLFALKVL